MPPRYNDSDFMKRSLSLFNGWEKAQQEYIEKGRLVPEFDGAKLMNFSRDYFRWQLEQWLDEIHTCPYCLRAVNLETVTCDHAIPKDRGGSFGWENLVFCCRTCNRIKSALSAVEYRVLLQAFADIEAMGGPQARKAVNGIRRSIAVGSAFQFGRQRRDSAK